MANIMSLKDVRNKVHRNGFDLSFKNRFTAKVGEILPVFCKECLPGDKFKIKPSWFSRTQPLNTAAYATIREYIDFYFVPYHLLWSYFPDWITQMNDPQFAQTSTTGYNLNGSSPFLSALTIYNRLIIGWNQAEKRWKTPQEYSGNGLNIWGYNRAALSAKLLNMLGYGDFLDYTGNNGSQVGVNVRLSPWRLLAYQKICQDFYRPQMWESSQPWRFNINYCGVSQEVGINPNVPPYMDALDLNYALYKKDYFTGLLPSPQYGDVSVAPLNNDGTVVDLINQANFDTAEDAQNSVQMNFSGDAQGHPVGISVLALRQAEALQKWREVSLSANNKSYREQMKRHFETSVRGVSDHTCTYIGGTAGVIKITDIDNTNLADGGIASIAGKGIGGGSGFEKFECHEHGIIIGLYHAVPEIDYFDTMLDKHNTKIQAGDFAIPEFDQIGMQTTQSYELFNAYKASFNPSRVLGYAPRFAEYKTSYDMVHGAFRDTLRNYIVPKNIPTLYQGGENPYFYLNMIEFLRVNPSVVDSIFSVASDSTTNTDQLLVDSEFDTKAVRPLDRDGLPY